MRKIKSNVPSIGFGVLTVVLAGVLWIPKLGHRETTPAVTYKAMERQPVVTEGFQDKTKARPRPIPEKVIPEAAAPTEEKQPSLYSKVKSEVKDWVPVLSLGMAWFLRKKRQ
jgi:hypothetical protein